MLLGSSQDTVQAGRTKTGPSGLTELGRQRLSREGELAIIYGAEYQKGRSYTKRKLQYQQQGPLYS